MLQSTPLLSEGSSERAFNFDASDDKIQSVSIKVSWTVNMLLKTSQIKQIKEVPCLIVPGIIYTKLGIKKNELVGCSDKFFMKFREFREE